MGLVEEGEARRNNAEAARNEEEERKALGRQAEKFWEISGAQQIVSDAYSGIKNRFRQETFIPTRAEYDSGLISQGYISIPHGSRITGDTRARATMLPDGTFIVRGKEKIVVTKEEWEQNPDAIRDAVNQGFGNPENNMIEVNVSSEPSSKPYGEYGL